MHISLVVDAVFATLMLAGGVAAFARIRTYMGGNALPKELQRALVDHSWTNLISFGWNSRYHLMAVWNAAATAAIIHWHLVLSGSVIALLFAATAAMLLYLKHKLRTVVLVHP